MCGKRSIWKSTGKFKALREGQRDRAERTETGTDLSQVWCAARARKCRVGLGNIAVESEVDKQESDISDFHFLKEHSGYCLQSRLEVCV